MIHLLEKTWRLGYVPLWSDVGRAEDLRDETGAVDGRVGVHGSYDDLHLWHDAGRLLLTATDQVERADTLPYSKSHNTIVAA